tara:strand:+ start:424 stop:669 length:246 start_codon:yes stop_codon:yes gene_type:complete
VGFLFALLILLYLSYLVHLFFSKKLNTMNNESIAKDVKSIKKSVQLIAGILIAQLIVVGLYIIFVAAPVINKMLNEGPQQH